MKINLNRLVPRGTFSYFTRRGNGLMIRCPFCGYVPVLEYGYQKWRSLSSHMAINHHGKEVPTLVKIGSAHGVEHSQDAKKVITLKRPA